VTSPLDGAISLPPVRGDEPTSSLRSAPPALTVRAVTSTPPPSPVPASALGPLVPLTGADRFLALVDHARAAVQAALAADAAARAQRAAVQQTGSAGTGDDASRTEAATVVPTQLEEVVSVLLSDDGATLAAITVVGSAVGDPSAA
jgi:hypothetical protein